MAYTWATPATMSVSMGVNVNAAGNIAQSGDTVAGTKTISINGIKKDATFAQAKTVYDTFVGDIAGGSYVESTAQGTIKFGVAEQS